MNARDNRSSKPFLDEVTVGTVSERLNQQPLPTKNRMITRNLTQKVTVVTVSPTYSSSLIGNRATRQPQLTRAISVDQATVPTVHRVSLSLAVTQ